MARYPVAVIGGGAAGMTAAISAARRGKRVVICERMPRLGKKVLISGNGRCNLSNEALDASFYGPAAKRLVDGVFSRFGKDAIIGFFKELGLETRSEGGRVFPVTDQASSVVRVLEMELERLGVAVELRFDTADIAVTKDGYVLTAKAGGRLACDALIIAGGGKAYPALGSDGSAYVLASRLGHRVVTPVPSAVPFVVKDPLCHFLQGQRIAASAGIMRSGRLVREASGDLLFTTYGLSGTAILDISDEASIALNRDGERAVDIAVDMVPFMPTEALRDELAGRKKRGVRPRDLLTGILPNKFGSALEGLLAKGDCGAIARTLKERRFTVLGTRGWNEAEFTSGGVDIQELDEATLGSKLKRRLYFAGEIIDVQARRGGYNLAWAWASGFTAGLAE